MTKLITFTQWKLTNGKFIIVREDSREYTGLWGECKKGRGQVEQNMKVAGDAAKTQDANAQAQYGVASTANAKNLASSQPGSLTPAAQAQLASDRDNISRTYNGVRQTAFQTLGQRGMGSAPSGFAATAANSADLGQANAETGAYRNAQANTQAEQNFGTTTAAGMSKDQGNLGIGNVGQSTTAAVDRSQMGSTLGDIGQGISTAAGIAGDVMGVGGMAKGMFSGIGGKSLAGQGTGAYT